MDNIHEPAGPVHQSRLHGGVLTIDTHIDIPWPTGPSVDEDGPRCVDLPKMRKGGLAAGCFVAYVPQGKRDVERHAEAGARALAMLLAIKTMDNGGDVRVVDTSTGIETAFQQGALAIIPAVENGYAMGRDLGMLAQFRALGACYLTLTHNGHNDLADSSNPRSDLGDRTEEHGGLSALGRAAIEELNRVGMLVDVSHVSRAAMLQAAAVSRTPVIATHSCMRALCDHPRNLDDAQLDALAAAGGVVQVTAVPSFLRRHGRMESVQVSDFVDHVVHAVRRIGITHVGISSDFDGGGGFSGWRNVSESPNITTELVARGFSHSDIAALWGGNFLRLMRAAEEIAE
jgi:membrane dipeptidase